MKVRIIKKLNENVGSQKHVPMEIQQARISIAMKIDRILQRPLLNVGQQQVVKNKKTGEMETRTVTDPKQTSMLYYVYKGIGPDGEILDNNNVRAVNAEINGRIEDFTTSLSDVEKTVLSADLDAILFYMAQQRSPKQRGTHQSSYMLKKAPGNFDSFGFATRARSVYKDTRAGKDFMLKSTPELKNIPREHHFLFSMENMIGRLRSRLPEPTGTVKVAGSLVTKTGKSFTDDEIAAGADFSKPSVEEIKVPVLTPNDYDSNYTLGTTTMSTEREDQVIKDREMEQSFVLKFYSDPNRDTGMTRDNEAEQMRPFLESFLKKVERELENNKLPTEMVKFSEISDNIPDEVYNPFEQRINDIYDKMEQMAAQGAT